MLLTITSFFDDTHESSLPPTHSRQRYALYEYYSTSSAGYYLKKLQRAPDGLPL